MSIRGVKDKLDKEMKKYSTKVSKAKGRPSQWAHKTAVKEAKHESAKEAWVLFSKEELENDGVPTS